jgi:hypothetical protein
MGMGKDIEVLIEKLSTYYRDLQDIEYECGQAIRTIKGKSREKLKFPRSILCNCYIQAFLETGIFPEKKIKFKDLVALSPIDKVDKNAAYIVERQAGDMVKFLDALHCLIDDSRQNYPHDDPISADPTREGLPPQPIVLRNIGHLCFVIETTIKQLAAHAQQVHLKMKGAKGGAAARRMYTIESLKKVKSALERFGGIDGFKNRNKRPEEYCSLSQDEIYFQIGKIVYLSPERVKPLISNLRKSSKNKTLAVYNP